MLIHQFLEKICKANIGFALGIDRLPCVCKLHLFAGSLQAALINHNQYIPQMVACKVRQKDHPQTTKQEQRMLRHHMYLHDDVFRKNMMSMTPTPSSSSRVQSLVYTRRIKIWSYIGISGEVQMKLPPMRMCHKGNIN